MTRKILGDQVSDEVKGFVEYIKSKGAKRDNVKSVDAQPIIPEDIKYQPEELPETFVDLKKFVNVQPVTTAAGSHPILNPAQETMISVEECLGFLNFLLVFEGGDSHETMSQKRELFFLCFFSSYKHKMMSFWII